MTRPSKKYKLNVRRMSARIAIIATVNLIFGASFIVSNELLGHGAPIALAVLVAVFSGYVQERSTRIGEVFVHEQKLEDAIIEHAPRIEKEME